MLWHPLVLVLDWTGHGVPKAAGLSMRQFTPWAQALGGFLAHHNVPGSSPTPKKSAASTKTKPRWRAFLACWHDRHGGKPMTAADLRKDGEPNHLTGEAFDAWDGQFITIHNGRLPNPLALGRLLTGQIGRWRGPYVVRGGKNDRGDRNIFWVERHDD